MNTTMGIALDLALASSPSGPMTEGAAIALIVAIGGALLAGLVGAFLRAVVWPAKHWADYDSVDWGFIGALLWFVGVLLVDLTCLLLDASGVLK